ncbi:aldo/keto reductase [Altericroceibacterium spongiae]|uniref:aldo/keto reductase n=1 Tax=Altericroceibacterium spongiae TaxID=2320269 RepID=UPI002368EBB3|nr:aldo/keto reductase [Altericroceibacterium spongiae]
MGGNVFGWTADEDASFAILDKFYENGGRMIDTAQGYSAWVDGHVGGESETVIGKWLDSRKLRHDMRIATKTNGNGEAGGLSPIRIAEELEKSLDRLQTDYVDLYYAHRDDTATPMEEIVEGFNTLVSKGKIREVGASNFEVDRLAVNIDIAQRKSMKPFTVLQNEYNLVERNAYSPRMQKVCLDNHMAMFPYFGLAAGFLTGKYRNKADLKKGERGGLIEHLFDKGMSILPILDEVVEETGSNHASVSLAWLLAQPGITAPIASARTPDQLDSLLEATRLDLSEDQLTRLNEAGQ